MEIDKAEIPVAAVPAQGAEEGNEMAEELPQPAPSAPPTSSPPETFSAPTIATTTEAHSLPDVSTKNKLRIYAAGKMMFFNSPSRDWRGLARYKELEWSDHQGEALLEKLRELRDLELDFDDNWIYVGPHFLHSPGVDHEVDYFYQLDDETRSGAVLSTVLRDEQRDFTIDEREKQLLYENARHQIEKCDVLYARLTDEKDCFWAFTEIGIAAALGKRVYIDCPVESHDTWLLPILSEHSKGTPEEYATIPWALYKH